MTNQDVMQIAPIVGALPMGDLAYSPALMLLHANLQQIAAEIEEQRRNLIADARKGADVPDDFDERIQKQLERSKKKASESSSEGGTDSEGDPEAEEDDTEILTYNDKAMALFVPAWNEVLRQEARLRFKLLTPEQFAALYAAVKAGPDELTVGEAEMPADVVLTFVAGLLVA